MRLCVEVHWKLCGYVPAPGSGAYGDWKCERRRWHIGLHRYRNYVIPRIHRRNVWRHPKFPEQQLVSLPRRTRYDPVPVHRRLTKIKWSKVLWTGMPRKVGETIG